MKIQLSYFVAGGSLLFILMGSIFMFMVFGFFSTVSQDMEKRAARKKIVASGQIDPLEAKVVGKRYERSERKTGIGKRINRTTRVVHDYWVDLEVATVGPIARSVKGNVYETISEGQIIQVYPIDETYVIPAFDTGDDEENAKTARWIFVSLASLPLLAGLIGLCVAIVMRRRRQPTGP
jgi:hypothetical protein